MLEKVKIFHSMKVGLILLAFSLSSCGYVKDKPPANIDVYRADQLQACKIDIDKLSEIFKENQETQIRCLKENFIQYTKYVKTSNSDSVNQSELGDFVRRIFQGQSDSIIKGLSIIFQLNMILLKDEASKISKDNITPLFELLISANREAIIITNVLKDIAKEENQSRFFELRKLFKEALERFSLSTIKIMESRGVEVNDQRLNLKKFIQEAALKLGNKDIDEETIDSLLFLKQIVVSGEKEIITSTELQSLVTKFPKLLTLTFDIYNAKRENFNSTTEYSKYILDGIKTLYEVFAFEQLDIKLFTIDEALNLIKKYFKNLNIDVRKFKPSIIALKEKLIGGPKETFMLSDLKKTLDMVIDVNEKIYFDNITFDTRSQFLLNNKNKINHTELSPIYPKEYRSFSARRLQELTRNFNQIIVDFKYFREDMKTHAYYGTQYRRTKYGVVEVSLMRWLANKLMNGYGHFEKGEMQVNLKEFEKFLVDMKPILEELKMWSPNFNTFARNTVLLSDLFQSQSNGDGLVNEREVTEYLTMVLSATIATNETREKLKDYCDPGINEDDALFEVRCFNDHFYNSFLNRAGLKKYFPRLNEYVNTSPIAEAQSYLRGVEGFARDINDPNIPMNKRDSILTIGSMINVETTFIRFDSNRDNIIDYAELMEAFKVYKDSIISLANLSKEQISYAPSIFLYMVSKMEVPPSGTWMDNLYFFTFHKCVSNEFCRTTMMDPILAKRLNIGTLLYYLVNQTGGKPAANKK